MTRQCGKFENALRSQYRKSEGTGLSMSGFLNVNLEYSGAIIISGMLIIIMSTMIIFSNYNDDDNGNHSSDGNHSDDT